MSRVVAALVLTIGIVLMGGTMAGAASGQVDGPTSTTSSTSSTSTSSTSTSSTSSTTSTSVASTTTSTVATTTTVPTSVTTTTVRLTTTTRPGFYEGPLGKPGDRCTVEGQIFHTADGEALVCGSVSGAAVLGASAAGGNSNGAAIAGSRYTGGPLAVNGQFCKKALIGTLGHSASGEALICARSGNPTTPQWRLATPAELASTTPAKVQGATQTRAVSHETLPLTGAKSLTTALVAVMVLAVGVILRSRSTKVIEHRAWKARLKDPSRPTWKPRQPDDDRWHW